MRTAVPRCFLAIPLAAPLVELAVRTQRALERVGADVKLTRREALHLTLHFFGDIEAARAAEVAEALRGARLGLAPALSLAGLGAFPERGPPRVLWAGIGGDRERLLEVARALAGALSLLGFPPEERPFSPHWTLGRVRSPRRARELRQELARLAPDVASAALPHGRIVLFESELGPTGSRYRELAEAALDAPGQ